MSLLQPAITVDWLALWLHFLSLSLLAVGGAISTVPDMHRYLVDEQHWLGDSQFVSSIALAQAAPGPNLLFVALLGWNVGLNAAAPLALGSTPVLTAHAVAMGLLGVFVAMVGILLPSTTLTFAAARWGHRNRELRAVRAFKQAMAPIVVGLLASTGYLMTSSLGTPTQSPLLWLVSAVSLVLVWQTRLHLLWMLAAGGAVGWMGWV